MSFLIHYVTSFTWFTVFETILFFTNVLVFLRYGLPFRNPHRLLDFLPSIALLIAIVSFLFGDITLLALVFYTVTSIVFLCTIKNVFKRSTSEPRFRLGRALFCVAGIIVLLSTPTYAGELRYNPVSEFSEMSYSQAFVQLNSRLSREYPFGEWKQVNWQRLQEKYEPLFKKAEEERNKDLYYHTLREYLFSFRDGHIKISNENLYEDNPVFKREAGGGFGISTIQLDNGKVLVNLVVEGSPAEQNGIKVGAEIITWGGKAAKDAYQQATWSETPMATAGDAIYNRGRFMVRAPIGKEIPVEYQNADDRKRTKVNLKAYDDNYETLKQTRVKWKQEDNPIDAEIVGDGYGYLKIRYFLPSETVPEPIEKVKEILNWFHSQNIKGLIIDVRDNPGGSDDLVAAMAGFFVPEETTYEHVSYYNRVTGSFELNPFETRKVVPTAPHYNGNIAIIINNKTSSSGEGLPILLKGLPQVKNVGFTGTNGSFGVVSSPIEAEMPEGYIVRFPDGRSLNQDYIIQGDSNGLGQGGGVPDELIPLNEETFHAKYVQGKDVELEYALKALEAMPVASMR